MIKGSATLFITQNVLFLAFCELKFRRTYCDCFSINSNSLQCSWVIEIIEIPNSVKLCLETSVYAGKIAYCQLHFLLFFNFLALER